VSAHRGGRHVLAATAGGLVLTIITACSSITDDRDTRNPLIAVRYHGVAIGNAMTSGRLPCTDGTARALTDSTAVHIVTFATLGDCLTCVEHLTSLEEIVRSGELDGFDTFIVAYASRARQGEATQQFRGISARPICLDIDGAVWEDHNLQNTPFTVILRNGRVRAISDTPLRSSDEQIRFLSSLRAVMDRDARRATGQRGAR
jgi:hypothetical protein